jgi:2,3-bisphosphoglycerate-independent phosphoglycerate mutase
MSIEKTVKKPICLIILDGWGISENKDGNAIVLADTPNMDSYMKDFPNTTLNASGESVGLPEGQMGNSEVGHLNIGAGRTVYQEFTRISKSIREGDFFTNPELEKAFENATENDKKVHLMGLVSNGGVHSHLEHLKALVDMAKKKGIKRLYIHAFLDGRDVPPRSAVGYLEELDRYLEEKSLGRVATVSGRYYAMDRDNRWVRTRKAYDALVYGKGKRFDSSVELVKNAYENDNNDEFVVPGIVDNNGSNDGCIQDGDTVIFFNFRPDRARQLTKTFIWEDFSSFDRGVKPPKVYFLSMTLYDKKFDIPVAFPPQSIKNTLGEVLSINGIKQLRIAETEKYAHVTFFFNGGVEVPYAGEDRILIPSPDVAKYDQKPEMSANEVTEALTGKIREGLYDVIMLNYANPDMVGHTGFLKAAIKAVETVDNCVGKIVEEVKDAGGISMIAADHGNAEEMICQSSKGTVTAHSTSRVPFIFCSNEYRIAESRKDYQLKDIAPTILYLLGIKKPEQMTGSSIVV